MSDIPEEKETPETSTDSAASEAAVEGKSEDTGREKLFKIGAAILALVFLGVIIFSFVSERNSPEPQNIVETPGFTNMPVEELQEKAGPLKVVWLGEDFKGSILRQHSLADNIDVIKKSDSVDQIAIVDYSLPDGVNSTYIATYSKTSPDSIKEFKVCMKNPKRCDFSKTVQTSYGPGLYKKTGEKTWELRFITGEGQGVYIINDRADVRIEDVAKTLEDIGS